MSGPGRATTRPALPFRSAVPLCRSALPFRSAVPVWLVPGFGFLLRPDLLIVVTVGGGAGKTG